jgi:hypothetical protein
MVVVLSLFARYPLMLSRCCAILCLKRALDSTMDGMNGQHGNCNLGAGVRPDSQAGVLSVLLSILASKRVVLDRQYGRNRLAAGLGSPMDSAK